jgi:hypothetical protein
VLRSKSSFVKLCCSIALWDLLLPDQRACTLQLNDAEASQVVHYSSRHRLLFAGGKKGKLSVYDLRSASLVESIMAFDQVPLRGLGMSGDYLVATSRLGEVKVFDVHEFGVSLSPTRRGRVLGVHEPSASSGPLAAATDFKSSLLPRPGPELLCLGDTVYTAFDGSVVLWNPDP